MTIERRALRMGRPPRLSIVLVVRLRRAHRGAGRRVAAKMVAGPSIPPAGRGWNIVQSSFKRRG